MRQLQIFRNGGKKLASLSCRMRLAVVIGILSWSLALFATTIVHGPRIGLVTQSAATIYWDTDTAGTGSVSWGTTSSYGSSLAETSSVTNHRLTISGLSASTTYHYKVTTGGVSSADYTFSTAVPVGTDFTFITMADSRGNSASADQQGLPQSFINIITREVAAHASFALFGGDMFYGSSTQATQQILYDKFKIATDPLAHTTPFLVAVGNHEMNFTSYSTINMFNQEFAQPQTGPSGYPGTVFSFDWGNSHFVIVDTCHVNTSSNCGGGTNNCMYYMFDDMLNWLDSDLASAQSRGVRHIFVMGHSHAYADASWTLNYMGNYPTQRDKFWTILANHKVDAYICGHIHEFHDNLGQQGVVQWLNGNSGAGSGPYDWTLWQIHGDTATATLYDDSGAQVSQLAIQSSQGGGCTLPAVSLTSPAGGATVSGVVTFAASVSASPAPSQVSFAVDGTTVATVTSSPWSYSWNSASVANGSHSITATAVNSCGSTTSTAVSVTVSNSSTTYAISGTVSGAVSSGVAVALSGTSSATATTSSSGAYTFSGLANGSYTVTPSLSGYTFSPASTSVTVNGANQTGINFTSSAVAPSSGVVNGGFESGLAGWTAGGVVAPTQVSNAHHSGSYSAKITGGSSSGDSTLYQDVAIPAGGGTLTFWYYPVSPDTISYDWQEMDITNTSGTVLATPLKVCSNGSAWTSVTYNMVSYAGTTVRLMFKVHDDGYSGDTTYMYVDDVSLSTPTATYSISGTVSGAVTSGVTMSLTGTSSATATTGTGGTYSFSGLANGSYTVTPSLSGYTFSPASTAVTVNGANQTGINFTATAAGGGTSQLLLNPGFESGNNGNWTLSTSTSHTVITTVSNPAAPHGGSYQASLGYYNGTYYNSETDYISQTVTIPSAATAATLNFWYYIKTQETTTSTAYDKLTVTVENSSGTVLSTLVTLSNLNKTSSWTQKTGLNLLSYKGQTVVIKFKAVTDSSLGTAFALDDCALNVTQ